MFIGGEFYYDGHWQAEKPTRLAEGALFLNGGKACLTIIADYLRTHGVDKILLPAYLCPSILDVFETSGLGWDFYPVGTDLSINLNEVTHRSAGFRAVYFINYFGFRHPAAARAYFKALRTKGTYVIEDNAQAGFAKHPSGDFVFNSLRKLVPYDGGYLSTPHMVAPFIEKYRGLPNRRLPIIRAYRRQLYDYLYKGTGSHRQLSNLYTRAEKYYILNIVIEGDTDEQQAIESLDWAGIRAARRENYCYLLSLITGIPEITPLFPALQADMMPMGLPIYVQGVSRDALYDYLGEHGVGLVIHWEELGSDMRTCHNRQTASMAARMLTLSIDQRSSRAQLDFQAACLARGIAKLKAASSGD